MSRPATDRLKVNPPLGMMPALQYLPPSLLEVDQSYQRTLDTDASKALVRGIAQHWNWDLCQPLVVARRRSEDGAAGRLFVIDGQHRLAAAKLRGDIAQLPAVVVEYASAADEAASFVHLNQQRRPLTKIDLFKAAVASGDTEAAAILAAVHDAGLTIAPHSNPTAWKPGMVSNIGGMEACWRQRGAVVTRVALNAMGEGLQGQVLQYAGTLFPGIAAVVDRGTDSGRSAWAPESYARLCALIRELSQENWRSQVHHARGLSPNLNFARASEQVFLSAWDAPVAIKTMGAGGAKILTFTMPDDLPHNPPPVAKPAPAPKPAPVWTRGMIGAGDANPANPAPKLEPNRGKAAAINWGKVTAAAGAAPSGALPRADEGGLRWCAQCDQRRGAVQIRLCMSKFCTFAGKA